MSEPKRYCFHADESFVDKDTRQYQIIRVVEGERGFVVVDTRPTLGDAVAEAATWNRDLGRTVDEVLNMRASSMAVSPPRPTANLIIVIGNPVSGLSFFGPFDSNEDVQSFVQRQRLKTWWIAQLISAERDDQGTWA